MVYQTLGKLKWEKRMGGTEVIILHRGAPGNRKVIKGEDITSVKKDHFTYRKGREEGFIPHHRVVKIRKGGKVLWKRKK